MAGATTPEVGFATSFLSGTNEHRSHELHVEATPGSDLGDIECGTHKTTWRLRLGGLGATVRTWSAETDLGCEFRLAGARTSPVPRRRRASAKSMYRVVSQRRKRFFEVTDVKAVCTGSAGGRRQASRHDESAACHIVEPVSREA